MKFLLGTNACNNHIQNVALALYEAGALGAFYTGFVDNYSGPCAKKIRGMIEKQLPGFDRQLRRRRIAQVPDELVRKNISWEFLRTAASRLGLDARISDWLWEQSEHSLDRKCARLLEKHQFDAFCGTEYGSLFSLRAAGKAGKKSAVLFLSPHHSFLEKWVHAEYAEFPELVTASSRRLLELAVERDRMRDEEARLAGAVITNSGLTTRSFVEAGFSPEKIITVPLGGSPAIDEADLPDTLPLPQRFLYAGTISVRKGCHYMLQAWNSLKVRRGAELCLYGAVTLPKRLLALPCDNLFIHDPVSQKELFHIFRQSSVLVFPTLCDGFGMVALEAMANGLPVITTANAGVADLIEEGKNGFLVPPRDAGALARRMEWCLEHPLEMLQMRRYALATARNQTWDNFRVRFRRQLADFFHVNL